MNAKLFLTFIASICLFLSARGADEKVISPAKPAPETKIKHVGVEEFAKLRANTNNIVLDVRTEKEFKAGHIPGAVNIDVNAPDFDTKAAKLDKGKTYLVHCVVGHRSEIACGKFLTAGFKSVYDFTPGLKGWEQAGHPVEK